MQADEGEDGGGPHPVWVRPAPRHGGTVVGRLLAGPLAPALAALRRGLAAQEGRLTLFAPLLLGWGIAHYFSLRTEPGLATTLFWALAAGAAGAGLLRWRPAGPALWLAAALVLPPTGMLLAKLRTEAVSAPRLARETGTVELSGRILGLARESPGSVKLLLAPRAIEGLAPEALPARIRLTVRGTPERLEALTSGAEITGLARLMPPSPPVAPGAYDFARAAWFDRIGGLGFTLGVPRVVEPAVPDRTGPALWLAGLREGIARRIAAALPEAPATAGIATALITGERAGVADSDYAALRDSGLAHLLAISGLHLTMVAGGAFWTLRLLLALFEGPALAWPTKKLAAAGGLIVTGAYLALSGAPVSAVRASLMLAVMFTAILLDRPAITLRLVSLAALVILALYPESLLEAGFQMSFAAVVALVAVYEHYRSWTVRFTPSGHLPLALRVLKIAGIYLLANMATSLVAGLATSPFSAFHFHRVSNYELIANLAAVPVMANLVMPAGLLGVILMPLGLEAGPLGVMAFGIETILGVGHGVSALPGAVTLVPAGPGPALGALCLGGLLIALTRGHLRWAGLAPIALGLVLWAGTPRPILLVDGDGETVALRAGDGGFAIVSGRTEGFSTERWIEREGLSEPSRSRQGLLTCDGWGCIGEAGGHGVALVEDGRALADDCRWAEIVIARIVVRDCPSARIVIDRFALWDGGAHAIWRKGEDLVVRSVAETRGQRPWSGAQ